MRPERLGHRSVEISGAQPVPPEAKVFRRVPGLWNRPDDSGQALPMFCYATYHLQVKTSPQWQEWVLDLGVMYTSAEVYIDGKKLFEAGKVGPSPGA